MAYRMYLKEQEVGYLMDLVRASERRDDMSRRLAEKLREAKKVA